MFVIEIVIWLGIISRIRYKRSNSKYAKQIPIDVTMKPHKLASLIPVIRTFKVNAASTLRALATLQKLNCN